MYQDSKPKQEPRSWCPNFPQIITHRRRDKKVNARCSRKSGDDNPLRRKQCQYKPKGELEWKLVTHGDILKFDICLNFISRQFGTMMGTNNKETEGERTHEPRELENKK